jgi:plastocyanin
MTDPTHAAVVGDTVEYTAADGRKHDAKIERLNGAMADLTATVDGSPLPVAAVPYDPAGGNNTWSDKSAPASPSPTA